MRRLATSVLAPMPAIPSAPAMNTASVVIGFPDPLTSKTRRNYRSASRDDQIDNALGVTRTAAPTRSARSLVAFRRGSGPGGGPDSRVDGPDPGGVTGSTVTQFPLLFGHVACELGADGAERLVDV